MFGFFRSRAPALAEKPSRSIELAAAIDAAKNPSIRVGHRRFDAAVVDRLTADWRATNAAIDQELRGQLDLLRNRSRHLFKNNEYAVKFGRMVKNNIVGADGFMFQARVTDPSGSPDTLANKAIETAWWRWMRPGNCEVTGQYSFTDLCRAMVLSLARDGEFLMRRVWGGGEFGYQLQMLDVSRLDTSLNRSANGNENAIIMGVEKDSAGRPVAYHLWTASAGTYASRTRERVLASEIIHRFIPIEDEQTRGVPWLHAAMRRLNDLNGYREAAVIAARIGASKMGFYTTKDGLPPSQDDQDVAGNFLADVSPGEFSVVPDGYSFQTFDPTYPHDQFDAFCKAALRGIASGIGVSYNGLANDLEGVNFSSIRAGVLDEREEWMGIQGWMISGTLVLIVEDWLRASLSAAKIRLPNGSPLPLAKFDKFSQHAWQGRRWQWVDPMKDIQSAVTAIENRLASPQQIAAQSGRDVEDILDDIAVFQKLAEAKGVPLAPIGSGQAAVAAQVAADAQAAAVDAADTKT